MTDAMTLTDDAIIAYFEVFTLDAHCAAVRTLRHGGPLTGPTIEQIVTDRLHADDDVVRHGLVVAAACTNPNTPGHIIDAALERGLAKTLPANCSNTAVTHPHLGPRLGELRKAYPELPLERMVANPAAAPGFLAMHRAHNPIAVLQNPNTEPVTADAIMRSTKGHLHLYGAHRVELDTDLFGAATRSTRQAVRANAYRNPRLSDEQLTAALAKEGVEGDAEPVRALCERLDTHLIADPFAERALLRSTPDRRGPRPELAAAALHLGPTGRSAANRLLLTGFAGTIGELFDVADTFEGHAAA